MEKKLFQSERKYFNPVLYFLGILFFLWLVYVSHSNEKPHEKMIGYFFMGLFSFFIFLCVRQLFLLKISTFYAKKLVVKDFFGLRKRVFEYAEIQHWVLEEKSNKHTHWKQLLVWFKGGKRLKWYSTDYRNFDRICRQIASQKAENTILKEKREQISDRKIALWVALVGVLFLYQFVDNQYFDTFTDEEISLKVQISGEVKISHGRRGDGSFRFSVKEFPDYVFRVRKDFSNLSLLYDLKKDNELNISILKSQYEGRILRNETASFSDKYIFPYDIKVVGVEGHFSFYDYQMLENQIIQSNKYWFLGFSLVAFGLAWFLAKFSFWKRKK